MKYTFPSRTISFIAIFIGFILIPFRQWNSVKAGSSASPIPINILAVGKTYIVNSTVDAPDADPSDGVCATIAGVCTLRAAIMDANFNSGADIITVPSGVYTLTRAGNDDVALLGDLDITDNLTIQGAGSGLTIVDGNGAVTGDRVFQITSTAKEIAISGVAIRNGQKTNTFDEGGGIYWDGGGSHLQLTDIKLENNSAYYGGGLYLNYSNSGDVVDLDHIIVHANTSPTAAAGGLGVNFGDFATLHLHDSQVYGNTAYQGGGIYFQGTPAFGLQSVSITNSLIFSNTASLSAGFENHSGNAAVPVILQNSSLYQNHANFYGGAIGNYGTLTITNTTLDSNIGTTRGGGIYNYEGGILDIKQSTLSKNISTSGGGIYSEYFIHNNAGLTLTNSTLSNNSASQDGGGIYADGGQINLYNTTLAANQVLVPVGTVYAGMGGGVYLASRVGFSAKNALIADNTRQYGASPSEPDDCFGSVNSLGYNLIETISNCTINNINSGNITGKNPNLGPLQSNGGPTQTQMLLAGSPAINAGEQPFCLDSSNSVINTDQRGLLRPSGARCDMGAYELASDTIAPTVSSIIRANANPTSAASVDFTVTFSESVTGVNAADFNLTTSGVSGAAVSGLSGSGATYTVTVSTGSGNGTIRLDVMDDNTIADTSLNWLGGPGIGDGNFTSGEAYTISKSPIFADVPFSYWANNFIERLYNVGITGGCSVTPLNYCPDATVTRAQMAVFLLKSMHGSSFTPPAVNGSTGFTDVATNYWAAAWIKQLAAEGITSGCGAGVYCPDATVTRAQMAVFLLKAKHGSGYTPPAATGVFSDVPLGYWAAAWIEQLAAEGVTSGCGAGIYCPDAEVTRAQMAVFLVKAFGLL